MYIKLKIFLHYITLNKKQLQYGLSNKFNTLFAK